MTGDKIRKLFSLTRKRTVHLMPITHPAANASELHEAAREAGKNRCRKCGERFTMPTEGGVPSCPEGGIHVAQEADDGE